MNYPGRTTLTMVSCIIFFILCLTSCGSGSNRVIIYVSVDQNYAEPILDLFEKNTQLDVLPVYDIEASNTTGLVNRLIAEKKNPQADVFWSGEFVQTIALKEAGALIPYQSPNGHDIPDQFKDPENYWTGFSGRARVFIVNTDLLSPSEYPSSLDDFHNTRLPANQKAIALPLFGTTYTHAAALHSLWGSDRMLSFFNQLKSSNVQLLNGNSSVRDWVASGKVSYGLTDTDDACGSIQRGDPVTMVIPDQTTQGTLVIPNTVGLVAGGPNPDNGRLLIDYLLSPQTLEELIKLGWCHVPLRSSKNRPDCLDSVSIRPFSLSLDSIYSGFKACRGPLKEIFLK